MSDNVEEFDCFCAYCGDPITRKNPEHDVGNVEEGVCPYCGQFVYAEYHWVCINRIEREFREEIATELGVDVDELDRDRIREDLLDKWNEFFCSPAAYGYCSKCGRELPEEP